MFKINDHGGEKTKNRFVSVCFNSEEQQYEIIWNSRFRSPLNKTFQIDEDYDDGAIDIRDTLIELYNNPQLNYPSVTLL